MGVKRGQSQKLAKFRQSKYNRQWQATPHSFHLFGLNWNFIFPLLNYVFLPEMRTRSRRSRSTSTSTSCRRCPRKTASATWLPSKTCSRIWTSGSATCTTWTRRASTSWWRDRRRSCRRSGTSRSWSRNKPGIVSVLLYSVLIGCAQVKLLAVEEGPNLVSLSCLLIPFISLMHSVRF